MMNGNQHTQHIMRVDGATARRSLMRAGVFCFLSAVFFSVHAETLPDPTRPPADVMTVSGARHDRGGESSSGLRSIIISQKRRAAIIDGKTVELGEMHGNARLVEVNAGSVVLQRGKNRQVLTLFPRVKITRMETADTEPTKMESSNHKAQADRPGKADKIDQVEHESTPVTHDEKRLTGHPKEEK
jgi:MSHA biogenesis protein MshK